KVPHAPMSHLSVKPEYKAPRRGTRRAEGDEEETPARTARVRRTASPRGTGPAGSREKPKTITDTKRARTLPATGRQKKAVARTLEEKKRDVARESKSKAVKREVNKQAK